MKRSQVVESANASPEQASAKVEILLLSTSLLVDRVFQYTNLVPKLSEKGNVTIWASSFDEENRDNSWNGLTADLEPFPDVQAFREFPYNYLRRLNEYVWDYRYKLPSRMSMMKHRRDKQARFLVRALKSPAKVLAGFGTEVLLEKYLERLLLTYPRSRDAEYRFGKRRPDIIVSTGPFQFEQPAIFSVAKRMNIPTIAYIPSWDNVSTKNRMVFDYDAYLVWNEQAKRELNEFYPVTRNRSVYVIGSPQFDVFYQERFHISREEFCAEQNLDADRPIIVYAIGSPNFLKEQPGAEYLAKRVAKGHLGNVQLLIRPHPIHDNAEMHELFDRYSPNVRLQRTRNAGKALNKRTQDETDINEWVNTFRHANVVVNLSSTVTIDAAKFDCPVVNLDFDPQPGQADQQLIKEVNHEWSHFKPIAESGGVWLANDFGEVETAIKTYLKDPALHREKRKWIVDHVCGYSDANCGERMAEAIVSFINIKIAGSNRTNDIK
ncbi:MAG: CDP-glycerol glycerophosphotransferase family protein [Pyrinomonadaceae bacterium]